MDTLDALDRYLDALRSMPNAAGAGVRALDHAEHSGLPPLEQYLAADAAQAAAAGETREQWLRGKLRTAWRPTLAAPHHDAPHRLAQAIANLCDAGLWPWA